MLQPPGSKEQRNNIREPIVLLPSKHLPLSNEFLLSLLQAQKISYRQFLPQALWLSLRISTSLPVPKFFLKILKEVLCNKTSKRQNHVHINFKTEMKSIFKKDNARWYQGSHCHAKSTYLPMDIWTSLKKLPAA